MDIKSRTIQELMKRGVPAKLNGFRYLVYGVQMVYNDLGLLDKRLTKELYPAIGKELGANWRSVEHSMRTAVKAANIDKKVSEFLAEVAWCLHMEVNNGI